MKKMFGDNSVTSGKSYDCPHVAACCLVVYSRHPKWSPSAVKSALITTGKPVIVIEYIYIDML